MPTKDLTPQLRTRLNRFERVVGIFILVATLLMIAGLLLYLRETAKAKGWFVLKAPYHTYLRSGGGIQEGDKVKLMGFAAGEITKITAMPPESGYDVFVSFVMLKEFYGYVWSDSKVQIKSQGLLGTRYLEVLKGDPSGKYGKVHATYLSKDGRTIDQMWDDQLKEYKPFPKNDPKASYFVQADEPPELASQMDAIVQQAKDALPQVLALTNFLTRVMANAADATERLNSLLADTKPIVANLTVISENLKKPQGALGEWLIPTNMSGQITQALTSVNLTLTSANTTLTNANLQLTEVATSLDEALDNLAKITGNLRQQVDRDTNIVHEVSQLIVNTDNLVQGLKRHWLLRSAFRGEAGASGGRPSTAPLRPKENRRQ